MVSQEKGNKKLEILERQKPWYLHNYKELEDGSKFKTDQDGHSFSNSSDLGGFRMFLGEKNLAKEVSLLQKVPGDL